jgi:glycerol kinase
MPIRYILALDQGTTSSRAIIFDQKGEIKAVAQKEFRQIYPQAGWVEHDANEIWYTQIGVASEVLAKAGLETKDIAAIGITNQRETTILWDKSTGNPICNAIVWQDRRTAQRCDELKQQGLTALIQQKTGLVLDAYFSATKIQWILENVPQARQLADQGKLAFGTVDSWLLWKFTNGAVHATDVSNAARTMLFNIHTLQWDAELLAIFNIPAEILPEVKSCSELFGETDTSLFATPIPITGIAGDQQAALFGQLCVDSGMVKNTYGTGCFMVMNTGETPVISQNNLLSTIAWQIKGKTTYALEGSVFVGGAVVQWLRDGLGIIQQAPQIEDLASTVADNGGVYFVPALTGLGAPHWDQYARGTIIGITRGTTAGHIARAALESIAFQVKDVLDAMQRDTGIVTPELRTDGGAVANELLMQFQADVFQFPVVRPQVLETTALGVAYLAGLAVGYWEDIAEIRQQWQIDRIFTPKMSAQDVYQLNEYWQKAVGRAKGWANFN